MQRWHFARVMVTNLFLNERIQTTHAKAKHIRPTAERVITIAKKFKETENEFYFRKLESESKNFLTKFPFEIFLLNFSLKNFLTKFFFLLGYLTSRAAIEKLMLEILPRLEDVNCNYTRVKKMDKRRRGDNTQMGYIEIVGK